MNAINQTLAQAAQAATESTEKANAQEKAAPGLPSFLPKADVFKGKEGYELYLEMPGVAKQDLSITLEKNQLKVSGKIQAQARKAWRREFRFGHFERSFTLSENLDQSKITAHLEQGLLKLTIPHLPERAPVSIQVS